MTTGEINSKVRGVGYANPDGTKRQDIIRKWVKKGGRLEARLEPDNPRDPNAIGLWFKKTSLLRKPVEMQIGYIGANLSKELAGHLRAGGKLNIFVTGVTGTEDRKKTLGVNILIRKK